MPGEVLGQLEPDPARAARLHAGRRSGAASDGQDLLPKSAFYDVGALLTSVGTGEAAITLLSAKGTPQPVVHSKLLAPSSKIAPASDVPGAVAASPLLAKYGTRVDSNSARELLAARLEEAQQLDRAEADQKATERKAKVDAGATPGITAERAGGAPSETRDVYLWALTAK